ncbi:hypothetical protein ACLMJK_003140 [Lecanora helva]
MSPRTDSYMSLCLEQALKTSQLKFQHGSIIVRGGKVIGRGHNDFMHGFDGGLTLKDGRSASHKTNRARGKSLTKIPLSQHAEVACIENHPYLRKRRFEVRALNLVHPNVFHGVKQATTWEEEEKEEEKEEEEKKEEKKKEEKNYHRQAQKVNCATKERRDCPCRIHYGHRCNHRMNSTALHMCHSFSANSQRPQNSRRDRRLLGSDLYVVRLCWDSKEENEHAVSEPCSPSHEIRLDTHSTKDTPKESTVLKIPQEKSLHDELLCPMPERSTLDVQEPPLLLKQPKATYSKPCHRCIAYIHSAGIKRAFWTNANGGWEGAKVQELVDALEQSHQQTLSSETGARTKGLTRHEEFTGTRESHQQRYCG